MKSTFKNNIISVTVNGSDVAVICKDSAGRNAVHAKILNNKTALGAFSKCAMTSTSVTYKFDTSASASSFASKIDDVRELWKEIIKVNVQEIKLYSLNKNWVKIKCNDDTVGKEVHSAINSHATDLGFTIKEFVKGSTYKDFRYKLSSSSESARFLSVLLDIKEGKEVPVAMPFEESAIPATKTTTATVVRTLPTVISQQSTVSSQQPTEGNVIITTKTPTGTQETVLTQTEVEQMQKNSTADTVNKKTIVMAAVAGIAVLLAIVLLLKR